MNTEAIQTRWAAIIEQRMFEAARVLARRKLSATEKELSAVTYEQTDANEDFALIRSRGDQGRGEGAQHTIARPFLSRWERTEVRVRPLSSPLLLGEVRVRVRCATSNLAEILEA